MKKIAYRHYRLFVTLFTLMALVGAGPVYGQPTADEILGKVDDIIAPEEATLTLEMMTHRTDGTEKIYRMEVFKKSNDLLRIEFLYPPVEKGRKMLRQGKNMWMMMKNLKKPMRVAFKDNFMGGDFNNSDVVRVNLRNDYSGTIQGSENGVWTLELKAKDRTVTYDKVLLWVRESDYMPLKAQYYTMSGMMLRELEYEDVKDFGGHVRPSRLIMKNMVSRQTFSVMTVLDMKAGVSLSPAMFNPEGLSL